MVPGELPDTCGCPKGTVLEGGKCVKKPPPKCTLPQIPNADGICTCPPPMLSGPKPGMCVCPRGTVLRGGQCVKVETCSPREVRNAAGVCITPEPKRKREKREPKNENEDEQRRQPRFDIDQIPGIGGGRSGGGFGRGGQEGGSKGNSPGR